MRRGWGIVPPAWAIQVLRMNDKNSWAGGVGGHVQYRFHSNDPSWDCCGTSVLMVITCKSDSWLWGEDKWELLKKKKKKILWAEWDHPGTGASPTGNIWLNSIFLRFKFTFFFFFLKHHSWSRTPCHKKKKKKSNYPLREKGKKGSCN